ncbi:MAG: serine/threonine protein kinase [Planctomycetes bacterium]|nr:serine/threonine protein kinase [Planctomycetota bacterium]
MNNQILDIDGFTIIKSIGTGARTTIYLARDEATRQKVALKRAILENPEDTRIFEQIENEYKVSQNIDHPYIRKCHKIIKKRKLLKVNEVLLSMEMFEGRSLEESNSFSLGDLLLIFRMIATALNGMHQRGYVHCDIKPNNILISDEGSIKIIDLGQSCKIGAIKTRIQGTPDYIAPEQVHKQHLSHRTDIFNFGATMYWALTGKNVPTLIPLKSEIGMPVNKIKQFRTPRQVYKQIPKKVSEIVMRCIEEKPAKRPENMSEIIATFDGLIRDIFHTRG